MNQERFNEATTTIQASSLGNQIAVEVFLAHLLARLRAHGVTIGPVPIGNNSNFLDEKRDMPPDQLASFRGGMEATLSRIEQYAEQLADIQPK